MTFFGGAGAAGGWSGQGNWNNQLRPNSLKRSTDGWDDEELGSVYNHRVVMRLAGFVAPYRVRLAVALGSQPAWNARALIVPVTASRMGWLYSGEVSVGSLPSVL